MAHQREHIPSIVWKCLVMFRLNEYMTGWNIFRLKMILFSIVIAGRVFKDEQCARNTYTVDTGNDASGRFYIGWWFGGVKMFWYVLFFHFHMVWWTPRDAGYNTEATNVRQSYNPLQLHPVMRIFFTHQLLSSQIIPWSIKVGDPSSPGVGSQETHSKSGTTWGQVTCGALVVNFDSCYNHLP